MFKNRETRTASHRRSEKQAEIRQRERQKKKANAFICTSCYEKTGRQTDRQSALDESHTHSKFFQKDVPKSHVIS